MPRSTSFNVRRFSVGVGEGTGTLLGTSVGSSDGSGDGSVDVRPSVNEPVGTGEVAASSSAPLPRLKTTTPALPTRATPSATAPAINQGLFVRFGGGGGGGKNPLGTS